MIDELITMKRSTYDLEFMEHLRSYSDIIRTKSATLSYEGIDKTLYRGNVDGLLAAYKIPSSLWCISKVMSGCRDNGSFPKISDIIVPNVTDMSHERFFARIKEKLDHRKPMHE